LGVETPSPALIGLLLIGRDDVAAGNENSLIRVPTRGTASGR